MTRIAITPHRSTLRGVQASRWTATIGGEHHTLPTSAFGWDGAPPIEAHCEVSVDLDHVRSACGLTASDRVALAVTWQASAVNVREVGAYVDIDGSVTQPLRVAIDPPVVAGTITLSRCLVLGRADSSGPGSGRDPAVARRRGSILWRDPRGDRGTIDFDADRHWMSVEAVDFAERGTHAAAAWLVDSDLTDLDAPASRTLRLLVNMQHRDMARVLADDDDPRARAVQSVLRWDVARQLIERAVEIDGFVAGFGDFAAGTVGGALQSLFQSWLPELPPAELRGLRSDAPAHFQALLQERIEMLAWP
jgi:hypothetical protein